MIRHILFQRVHLGKILILCICLLQFVHLPFVAESNRGAKQFALILIVLSCSGYALLGRRSWHLPRFYPLFGLAFLATLLSTLTAYYQPAALAGFAAFSTALMLLLLSVQLFKEDVNLFGYLLGGVAVVGTIAASLGLYQYIGYLQHGPQNIMLIPWLLPPGGNYGIRCTGIFGQPNFNALFLVVTLISYCWCLGRCRSIKPRWTRHLRLVPVFLIAWVFFLTQSRAGMISLLGAVGILVYLVVWRKFECENLLSASELKRILFILVLAWVAGKFFSSGFFLESLQGNATLPTLDPWGDFDRSKSTDQRILWWLSATLIFLDQPWLGIGLDNFKLLLADYQVKALSLLHFDYHNLGYSFSAHNEYLQLLCEVGGIVFAVVALLVGFYLVCFYRDVLRCQVVLLQADRLFCYLFLLPFFVQASFGWPLRYASLQALFVLGAGALLARYRCVSFRLPKWRIYLVPLGLVLCLGTYGYCLWQEVRVTEFRVSLRSSKELSEKIQFLDGIATRPYSEYVVLRNALPGLVGAVVRQNDQQLAEDLLPNARRIVALEDSYWAWYNLSRLNFVAGHFKEASVNIRRSIDRMPGYEPAWKWQHRMNMEKVSRKTGVSMDDLLEQSKRDWEKLRGRTGTP